MINLWVVSYHFFPDWAGPAERFYRYANYFKEQQIHTTFITKERAGFPKTDVFNEVDVRRLENSNTVFGFIKAATELAAIEKPKAVIVLLGDNRNTPHIKKLKKLGIKVIYVNTMLHTPSNSKFILKRIISNFLYRHFYNAFDQIVCSTGFLKDALVSCGVGGRNISIIGNGVSLNRFCPSKNSEEIDLLRTELDLPRGIPLILYVGLIVDRKGVLDLLRVWKDIGTRHTAKLVIVGDEKRQNPMFKKFYNQWDAEIKSLTGVPDIIFRKPSREIEKYFKACDLFIFLSKEEGMPNVLSEAMACGLATITTQFKGYSDEWGSPGENFVLVERDQKKIASEVDRLINDEPFRKTVGKNGAMFCAANLAIEKSIAKYVAIIKSE